MVYNSLEAIASYKLLLLWSPVPKISVKGDPFSQLSFSLSIDQVLPGIIASHKALAMVRAAVYNHWTGEVERWREEIREILGYLFPAPR